MSGATADALLAQGAAHYRAGRHAEAEAAARRVLAMAADPAPTDHDRMRLASAWQVLGGCRAAGGDLSGAAEAMGAALAAVPGRDEVRLQQAVLLARLGRHTEVVALLQEEVRRRPDFLAGYRPLAEALWETGARAAAVALYRGLVERRPDDGAAHAALGAALRQTGQPDAALPVLRRAVALLEPAGAADRAAARPLLTARIALGEVLAELAVAEDRYSAEAAAVAHAVRAMGVEDPDILTWLGFVLTQAGEFDAAEACFSDALDRAPLHYDARVNRAMLRLQRGDHAGGWRDYQMRLHRAAPPPGPEALAPWIAPADLRGQRVRVVMEQGAGDQIQFARYLPLLAARGAAVEVALAPAAPLRPLLAAMPSVEGFVDAPDAPGTPDVVVPVMSLPPAFGTGPSSIPAQVPYLRAPPARREAWRRRLGPGDGRPRVGVVWWGNPGYVNDRRRSIPLARFAPLLRRRDVAFHVLADRPRPEEAAEAAALAAVHEGIGDFADTAALVEAMDLVIAVDTAVAHLAGALARPVWILLPFPPDWRWMLAREDSPWYPTARLFRQTTRGDWDSVLRRVQEALDGTFG